MVRSMTQQTPPTLLCLGFGYTARAVAAPLLGAGWRIIGTTRDSAETQPVEGVDLLTWPGDDISFDGVTHILVSIAPSEQGDPVLGAMAARIATLPRLEWVGYLSTTAVYGDHGGGWVDETTPLSPSSPRGEWRARAETEWQSIADLPLHIFRLAGIYGPGRGPFAKLMSGRARRIVKPGQVFSRIHVDDIAQVLLASVARPNPGAVYNVCDDEPAPPQDVLGYAAELLGLPVPAEVPFEEAGMSPMARSFYGENKRVRNDRIKAELGVRLLYPDYRSGLKAVLAAEDMERFVPPADPPGV
ncbi:MAG: NAD(P)-dependent oxidoreductase [Alphaproteobacteria bacterium MedPE-SWcel]|nr:MAG: NAD(P)-dependent oxidoreductase [Alphaproteobacteria bacterium MedPE-SWcel]